MNNFKSILIYIFSLIFAGIAFAEPEVLTLEDSKGRAMEVSIVRKEGEKVVIRRVSDGKEFAISPDSLSEDSKKLLLEKAENLKLVYPPVKAEVVIGTRRKDYKGSYYRKKMEVTAKLTLKNMDVNRDCPPCTGSLIFIGQSQSFAKEFKILSKQEFALTPTKEGAHFETDSFSTIYDSDNKGAGNLGGFKYEGYLLVVRDREENVLLTKTVFSKLKSAIAQDASFVEEFSKWGSGTLLTDKMQKR